MERQISENNDLPDDVKLESMLMNLTINESPKTHLHVHPDTTSQNVSSSLELEEETTCEEQNELDSTVRSDVDEEITKKSETKDINKADEDFKGFPDVVPTLERRLPPLYIQTRKKDDKELRMEEPMEAGAALLHNSQKESPSQRSCTSTFYLPKSSKRDDVSQTELKDEACGSVTKLTRQRHVNVTGRSRRSASDPEGPCLIQKPKEPRPLSAPSVSNLNEYEDPIEGSIKDSGNLIKGSSPTGRKDSCIEESFGEWEHDMSKLQNKGMKNKVKTFTQKMVGMLKEKPNRVHIGSKSSQDSVEEEAQSLSSMEMEVEEPLSPPPLPPKRGRYVHLKRMFTLRDFELNLEPINLMEEVFTGEEWLPYLPSKTSSPQKDAGKQAMPDDVVHPDKNTELHQMTTEQNQTEDGNEKQSDVKQDIINEDDETISELDNKRKENRHLPEREIEPNAHIFAIPKALLSNAAKQQRQRRISSETNNSDDVYDCMGTFVIPKYDFLLMERRSLDVYLDFSTVKALELLDNSALKSRIRLSKKRPHRPPKKYRKEKAQRLNSKFYEIPS
ncbi:uncharacterized protein si:dkey-9i23.6 [Triplophysa rosa]|uniref:Uncharacterized protein n=1 Tax=Triplophysa rosa TaxID=992332 RepID=A0A9W7WYD1_TRIRA|nr:uncharacterized protein si:dkey-9i23.6 [Triplophysa rosa]KAI7810423.1 hypothetical protein IRJ41_001451 [Triplophysa rosa]